jgi:hypothetical protein
VAAVASRIDRLFVVPSDVDRALLNELGSRLIPFLQATASRPLDVEAEETETLREFASHILTVGQLFGQALRDLVREGVTNTLRELVQAEYATSDAEEKFAVRQLATAVNVLGVLCETFAPYVQPNWWTDARLSAEEELSPLDRLLLRFELDVIVGIHLLFTDRGGPLLRRWAQHAASLSRTVQAELPALRRVLMGEDVRHQARNALGDWDDEEIAREVSWPGG